MARKEKAIDIFEYDSVSAAFDAAGTPPLLKHNRDYYWRDNFGPDGAMIRGREMTGETVAELTAHIGGGPITVPKIKQYILTGWEEGLTKIRDAFGKITVPELPDIRRKGTWSEIGDDLNLDRLYNGNDRPWRTSKRGIKRVPPPIHIIVDQGVNCGADGMFWRGAAPVALAEQAALAGYRVAVSSGICIYSLNSNGASFLAITKIKGVNDPLNLASAAAMMAHPVSSRIMDFGHCCQVSEEISGWGGVGRVTQEMLRERGCIDEKSLVLLIQSDIYTQQQAQNWLTRMVAHMNQLIETGEWLGKLQGMVGV